MAVATVMTGGCQCGRVRYDLRGSFPIYACHCLECQKQSGSAFGLSIPVKVEALSLSGDLQCYERSTDSGARTACHFCPRCGTRIYHQSSRSPDWLTLKGGTLDDTSELRPMAHLWVSRRQTWLSLDADVPRYATQPDNLAEWRAGLMGAGTCPTS